MSQEQVCQCLSLKGERPCSKSLLLIPSSLINEILHRVNQINDFVAFRCMALLQYLSINADHLIKSGLAQLGDFHHKTHKEVVWITSLRSQ
jgi:hypothetical protein